MKVLIKIKDNELYLRDIIGDEFHFTDSMKLSKVYELDSGLRDKLVTLNRFLGEYGNKSWLTSGISKSEYIDKMKSRLPPDLFFAILRCDHSKHKLELVEVK